MTEYVVLVGAAIVAGALNAIAGGGSFISLPVLLFYGVPPTTANATSAASLLPGYVGSLFGFRRDVAPPPALGVKGVALIALVGGMSGALLLLASGDQAFSAVVPWLMLFATVVFALSPQIKRLSRGRHWPLPLVIGALFATCVYGGYFNGGAGIVIIALLGLQGPVAVSYERRVGVLKSSQARRESPVVAGHDQDLQRRLGRFEAQPFGTRAQQINDTRQYSVAARLRRTTTRHLLTPRLAAKQPLARSRTKRQQALGVQSRQQMVRLTRK